MSEISTWQVLIVEDEPDSMDVVQEVLGYYNIATYSAYSAEEALELMKSVNPTLLILDLALPMMDGWGLLSTVRSDPKTAHIPAVAVTALHSANVAQEAIK